MLNINEATKKASKLRTLILMHTHWRKIERISVLLVALVYMPGQQSIAMVSNVNSYEINFAFKLIFHCFIPMTQKMIFFVISTSCSKYSWSAASSFLN